MSDDDVLRWSWDEACVLLTEEWDLGELAVRLKRPAHGMVIVSTAALDGDLDDIAEKIARRMTRLGETLLGRLTIIEPGRTRQRDLASPD